MNKTVRMIALTSLGLAALLAFGPALSAQATAAQDINQRVANLEKLITWDAINGLGFASPDGNFKLKIGGRLHNDWLWGDQDSKLEDAGIIFEDGVQFRRARIGVSGMMYNNIEYKAEYDFAGPQNGDFKDVYLALHGIPMVGTFKVGHFKEPFSIEELTSSNFITFMERGQPNWFAPSRNTGMQLSNSVAELDDKLGWAIGLFKDTDEKGDLLGGTAATKWAITGRAFFVPMYENDGEQVVHVGLAATRRAIDGLDEFYSIGLEAAAVYGPFSGQLEFVHNKWDDGNDDDTWNSFYLYGSWFATGERRNYLLNQGAFGRVMPANNFDLDGNLGAIELALRYAWMEDFQSDITAGVNWYLNPNTRVMMNYQYVMVDKDFLGTSSGGSGSILALRFQWDF